MGVFAQPRFDGEMMTTQTELCKEIDTCPKVQMVLDNDLPGDAYYKYYILEVCRRCWLQKDIENREKIGFIYKGRLLKELLCLFLQKAR